MPENSKDGRNDPLRRERRRMAAERWMLNAITATGVAFTVWVVVVHLFR